jgi:hypothetical protein
MSEEQGIRIYYTYMDPDLVFQNILDPDIGFQNAIFSKEKKFKSF